MNSDALLKCIAETGYNIGFGSKKHFATYDIVEKVPGTIGFISMAIGVLSLVLELLSAKWLSAVLIVAGIGALYISFFNPKKHDYVRVGTKLTTLFNDLRDLYRTIQSGGNVEEGYAKLKEVEEQFYQASISNQIVLSDWYAHYKFFAQMQIDWIDEQKKFTWRDRVPLSFLVTSVAIVIAILVAMVSLVFKGP